MNAQDTREREAARRVARRLGIPDDDIEEPDAMDDLRARIRTDQRVRMGRTPLTPLHVDGPPDPGRKTLSRYPLDEDRPPETGEVPLATDVALGLDEALHKAPGEKGKREQGRRGNRGTA